ncbi:MAG: glycosyltransferase [Campylobacterales bacterium]|nr:glycosyltransferase [Campylobacterales bacterium]
MCFSVAAVIVTYGDRFNLVNQVIFAAFEEGVSQIVLVDNASVEETRNELDKFIAVEPRLTLIRHSENLGSAGGYHSGLSYVLESLYPDFIWMLDDDNVPQENALKNLLNARDLLLGEESGTDLVLYSYRGDVWADDKSAVTDGLVKGYRSNNFMGFNFLSTLRKKLIKNKVTQSINYPIVRSNIGPYGGMLISFGDLKRVGLPNKDFYLYADDHEFSLRFESYGIKQYLVYPSRLKDIDVTFSDGNRFFSAESSDFKLFYSIRNHVYLSQNFIEKRTFYNLNKFLFLILSLLKSIPFLINDYKFYFSRLRMISRAISDGENGRLGKTF